VTGIAHGLIEKKKRHRFNSKY